MSQAMDRPHAHKSRHIHTQAHTKDLVHRRAERPTDIS